LSQAISLARRNQKRVAVLLLDLDHFQNINDTFGHHVGDSLLEAVSMRLRGCLRESDIAARLDGDKFAIALPAIQCEQGIREVVQKLLASLLESFQIEGHEMQISSSIGISQYPADGENPGALVRAADTAMYEAKAEGRGIYWFFTPRCASSRLMMVNDLRHASKGGEFILYYQPRSQWLQEVSLCSKHSCAGITLSLG
jgi:diguanylate cyclase (GGDEF)-like protein